MAGAIMEKVWGLFGMEPAEDRDEEIEEVDTEEVENDEEEQEDKRLWGRKNNKVVAMPSQPTTF